MPGGEIKEESDVDIALVFSGNPDEETVFKLTTDLASDLSLSLGKEVNVIPIFSDFRKPMLYYNAVVLGTPVYISNRGEYVKLFLKALFEMEDFNLFGSKWQLAVAADFLRG